MQHDENNNDSEENPSKRMKMNHDSNKLHPNHMNNHGHYSSDNQSPSFITNNQQQQQAKYLSHNPAGSLPMYGAVYPVGMETVAGGYPIAQS